MAAALFALEEEYEHAMRRERVFRDRSNPLESMGDGELISKYRLNRVCIFDLINELNDDLKSSTNRNYALPPHLQVLTALRFYATGSFQAVVGDTHGIHKSTVSRCIYRVSTALSHRVKNYISFPQDQQGRNKIKQSFHDYAEFPHVLGAIDGTLIPIKKPIDDEHLYLCRKGFHAINVQAIAEPSLKFLSIVVQFPGSTHDSYIWQISTISRKIENGNMGYGWLLGDSGYPLLPHLLTPIRDPHNRPEERYNSRHKRARSVIEQAFGLLKLDSCACTSLVAAWYTHQNAVSKSSHHVSYCIIFVLLTILKWMQM